MATYKHKHQNTNTKISLFRGVNINTQTPKHKIAKHKTSLFRGGSINTQTTKQDISKHKTSLFTKIFLYSQNISPLRLAAPWVSGWVLELYRSFQFKSFQITVETTQNARLFKTLKRYKKIGVVQVIPVKNFSK